MDVNEAYEKLSVVTKKFPDPEVYFTIAKVFGINGPNREIMNVRRCLDKLVKDGRATRIELSIGNKRTSYYGYRAKID